MKRSRGPLARPLRDRASAPAGASPALPTNPEKCAACPSMPPDDRPPGSSTVRSVLKGPRKCIVGNLLPPVLGRHEMRATGELLDLGDRVRRVVLRVRMLDGGRHQMILAPRDEEKGCT